MNKTEVEQAFVKEMVVANETRFQQQLIRLVYWQLKDMETLATYTRTFMLLLMPA